MSRKLSRSDALEDVSTWSIDDVLEILRKNGLENCCKAVAKRQIDGEELLHLTEGKLALWKSDLTRPLIWELWTFVEEIRKEPERFVEEKHLAARKNVPEYSSDTDSWGTDFEDNLTDTNPNTPKTLTSIVDADLTVNCVQNNQSLDGAQRSNDAIVQQEETYENFDTVQEAGLTYENFQDTMNKPQRNVSRLQGKFEKSLAEQLKEHLELREARKPTTSPKTQTPTRGVGSNAPKLLQKPTVQNVAKPKPTINELHRRAVPPVPPPTEPKKPRDVPSYLSKPDKCLPKPPMSIRNLDLVANLPTRTDESEDEYEPFDEQIIEQNQRKSMLRVDSKQSLASGRQSSAESIYKPGSIASHEEEEQYEIYESITETLEDNGYVSPIQRSGNSKPPPPLPAKPPPLSATPPPPASSRATQDKLKERSPDKKSATLPHSGSNSSIATERATRPLPPPPDRQSYTDKPWFHNVTRDQATALIKEQSTYGNPLDGYFLLRPSTTNAGNPLVLVLWYKDRVYNIPVRKRPDNRYALGTAKVNEQSFGSVEEMVSFHSREELVLNTGGVETGSTKLTDSPPK